MTDDFDHRAARLMRRFDRMAPAVRAAVAPEVMGSAQDMAAQMRRIAPRDDDPNNGEQVADHIYAEKGRLGDISAVVIADAKDAQGRAKASRVELGHVAADGTKVPASPYFYPVVRASGKPVKRRMAKAMRKAIRKEAGL